MATDIESTVNLDEGISPYDQETPTGSSFNVRSEWLLESDLRQVQTAVLDPMSILIWWSSVFLAGEVLSEGDADRNGFVARFHTKGLLPHSFHFTAQIDSRDETRMIIKTAGDFEGKGTINVSSVADGTMVVVDWRVDVRQPYLQPFLKVLKPVFVWNHLWAMRQGKVGLETYLASDAPPTTPILRPTFPHNFDVFRIPSRWRH